MGGEPTTLGPYRIERELGRGGMGVVYLARDSRLDRPVAIKALPREFLDDPERRARFEREARVLASLNHPSIASIYGLEETDGATHLVLEYIQGETLASRLGRGPIPADDALRLACEIAGALEAAHDRGVIHRDLKPGNVMLTPEEHAKVLDFGLARSVEPSATALPNSPTIAGQGQSPTMPGVILGTAGYMSPEQARGKPVDRRTDVFSFGILLYEMLTGVGPFAGETVADAMAKVIAGSPDLEALPRDVPRRAHDVIERCLRRDRDRRWRDMGDIRIELQEARESPADDANQPISRRLPWVALGVLSLALIAVGGALGWVLAGRARPAASQGSSPDTRLAFILDTPEGVAIPGVELLGSPFGISPDGRTIAFVGLGDRDDGRLFVRDLGSLNSREITGLESARGPVFSPDGRWLAVLDGFDRLVRVPLDGGPKQTIFETLRTSCRAWVWTDSGHIVFRDDLAERLFIVPATGGTPEPFKSVRDTPMFGLRGIEVLAPAPGGLLAGGYTDDSVEDYKIVWISVPGGEVVEVADRAAHPQVAGTDLVFLRDGALLTAPWDPQTHRLTGDERLLIPGVSSGTWSGQAQYALSTSGTLVYVPGSRRGEGRRLAWIEPDGAVLPMAVDPDAFMEGARLSPDGRRLVTTTLRRAAELWCYDVEQGTRAPLNRGQEGEVWTPIWNRDGSRIAFWRSQGLEAEIVIVDPTGRVVDTYPVPPNERIGLSSWLPDGRGVLVSRLVGSDWTLAAFHFDSPDSLEPVVETLSYEGRVSPDGEWLLYSSFRTRTEHVYLRRIDGSGAEVQVTSRDGGDQPEWSPDGSTIYFKDSRDRLNRVALGVDEGGLVTLGPAALISEDPAFGQMDYYSVAPDGRIAIVQLAPWETREKRLHVITNALREP
ncbi:MAG: serine/threonine-protein kinase [Phycisphaeraceae bacterium]|nr:serine/threonine-protein kinase [Phycisphaeraceae bacterium]